MKLVFMGTPSFAAVALQVLINSRHEILAVYSQPPRPAGRGYAERKSVVYELARRQGLDIRTPHSLKSHAEQGAFRDLGADAAVVVAYGLILPKAILQAPAYGCFNIHASLLPRWRGAAPIQRAIMAGDRKTGVSIMRMDEGLDTGPVCRSESISISESTTAGQLHEKLAELGAKLLLETLDAFPPQCAEQPGSGVTYARKIGKVEARIDFSQHADMVRNQIHGLSPFPGAWCRVGETRIKVLQCETVHASGDPGTVLDGSFLIACAVGAVRFLRVQREGKSPMSAQDFARGFELAPGARLS